MQKFCSPKCSIDWAKSRQEKRIRLERKRQRDETRRRKEALKKLSDYIKECQRAFNALIRERDYRLPCVTCGAESVRVSGIGGGWDAGHYKTVAGFPELRFDFSNCHKQCKSCNSPGPNKADWVREQYDINIITRVGESEAARLNTKNDAKHYTREELKTMAKAFRAETRRLARCREDGLEHKILRDIIELAAKSK